MAIILYFLKEMYGKVTTIALAYIDYIIITDDNKELKGLK